MKNQKRKHYRVATKNVHETPANGVYITKAEQQQFCIYSAIAFIFLATLAFFPRKR